MNIIKAQRSALPSLKPTGGALIDSKEKVIEKPSGGISAQQEHSKENEVALSEQQQYDQWLANPENKENALSLASQIIDKVGKNWFTINRFLQKTKLDRREAIMKLQMVKLFGFAQTKLGNFRDGAGNIQVPMFKITITNESKIQALDQVIQYHKDQIEAFEVQKKLLISAQ